MNETTVRRLLAWGQCQNCMAVSEGWAVSDADPAPCPNCGQSGYELEWPPEPARLLLKNALRRDPDDAEDSAVVGFLVATALDVMVAWLLGAAVDYYSTDSRRAARLVDRVRDPGLSTEQRLDLLKDVTDLDYKQVAAIQDEEGFPPRWRELREARDLFVHSFQTDAFQPIPEADLLDVARMAIKVFARFNNMIW